MYKIIFLFFLTGCSSFYYYPHKKIYITPDKLKLHYEEAELASSSSSKLNTWIIKKSKNTKSQFLVAQFHGNAENMSTHFVSLSWLTDHSFDILTFDYSGYGKSEGEPSPKVLRQDALSFLNHTLKVFKEKKYKKLIIYAQSLGGAIAMDALDLWAERDLVDLLVLDSTFTSYRRMGKNIMQRSWFTYLFSPLAYVLLTNVTAPEERLDKLTMPKLVIHSEKDHVVDYEEGKNLFFALPEKKEFWSMKEPGHVSIFFVKEKEYRSKFVKFINETL